jgi:hypothetical protein
VSEKKLIEDGTWALRKEVLGWLFDRLARITPEKMQENPCRPQRGTSR